MLEMNTRKTMQVTRSLALSTEPTGGLVCVRGEHLGQMISLPGDKAVVFGRDPAVSNIVLKGNRISRKHCQITYVASLEQYRIVDHSKNGTFLGDGTRLQREKEYYVKPATEIYIGDKDNLYKFR